MADTSKTHLHGVNRFVQSTAFKVIIALFAFLTLVALTIFIHRMTSTKSRRDKKLEKRRKERKPRVSSARKEVKNRGDGVVAMSETQQGPNISWPLPVHIVTPREGEQAGYEPQSPVVRVNSLPDVRAGNSFSEECEIATARWIAATDDGECNPASTSHHRNGQREASRQEPVFEEKASSPTPRMVAFSSDGVILFGSAQILQNEWDVLDGQASSSQQLAEPGGYDWGYARS